jgi:hypothetical protein
LAELQASGYVSTIITQNIDGLHTRAGAKNVLELHGSMNSLTCINCFQQVPSEGLIHEFVEHCTVPHCKDCGGIMKPDVILYEEQLPVKIWNKAEEASRCCDLMLIAGTSLEVMPSAKLPILALDNGASIIIINNMSTYIDVRADVIIREDVAMILPLILQEVSGAEQVEPPEVNSYRQLSREMLDLSAISEPEMILEYISGAASRLTDSELAWVFVPDHSHKEMRLKSFHSNDGKKDHDVSIPFETSLEGRVLTNQHAVMSIAWKPMTVAWGM